MSSHTQAMSARAKPHRVKTIDHTHKRNRPAGDGPVPRIRPDRTSEPPGRVADESSGDSSWFTCIDDTSPADFRSPMGCLVATVVQLSNRPAPMFPPASIWWGVDRRRGPQFHAGNRNACRSEPCHRPIDPVLSPTKEPHPHNSRVPSRPIANGPSTRHITCTSGDLIARAGSQYHGAGASRAGG